MELRSPLNHDVVTSILYSACGCLENSTRGWYSVHTPGEWRLHTSGHLCGHSPPGKPNTQQDAKDQKDAAWVGAGAREGGARLAFHTLWAENHSHRWCSLLSSTHFSPLPASWAVGSACPKSCSLRNQTAGFPPPPSYPRLQILFSVARSRARGELWVRSFIMPPAPLGAWVCSEERGVQLWGELTIWSLSREQGWLWSTWSSSGHPCSVLWVWWRRPGSPSPPQSWGGGQERQGGGSLLWSRGRWTTSLREWELQANLLPILLGAPDQMAFSFLRLLDLAVLVIHWNCLDLLQRVR